MDKSHTVVRLDVHLPGRFRNMNKDQIPDDLISVGQKGSKLEAWFNLNKELKEKERRKNELQLIVSSNIRKITKAERELLSQSIEFHYYWQIPELYTWDSKQSKWRSRRRKTDKIGRMYHVSPAQPDLYHLSYVLKMFFVNLISEYF